MPKSWIMSDFHYEILSPDVTEHLPRPEADVLVTAVTRGGTAIF